MIEMATPASTPAQASSEREPRYYPASISEEEAVRAARIAAKLMTAGEDFFRNQTQDAPAADQDPPYFRIPETDGGRVLIEGLGDAYVEWNAGGSLYFNHGASAFLPARMEELEIGGYAAWVDEERNVLFVSLEETDAGSLTQFTVDINGAVVTRTYDQAASGDELLELSDDELRNTANFMASLMIMAEDYYRSAGGALDSPPPDVHVHTFASSVPYGSFSWAKDSAAYLDGPGVKRDGFVNTQEEPVDFSISNVLDRAKAELDRDWGEASISRDEQAKMWRVDFFESTPLRPTEICSVYLSDKGITRLIVYGE